MSGGMQKKVLPLMEGGEPGENCPSTFAVLDDIPPAEKGEAKAQLEGLAGVPDCRFEARVGGH
jgi:hypothetical protein